MQDKLHDEADEIRTETAADAPELQEHDRVAELERAVEEANSKALYAAAEVASSSDVLLSILPDVAALREVILGPNGTLTKLRPGTVHVEMSTLDVPEKAALRGRVRSSGGDLLDCPISGTPAMVRPRAGGWPPSTAGRSSASCAGHWTPWGRRCAGPAARQRRPTPWWPGCWTRWRRPPPGPRPSRGPASPSAR